jgi:superfamily II DNA or RNA helicase
MPEQVKLLRSGNRLVISPTTPRIRDIVTPSLRYIEKVYVRGAEQARRRKANIPLFDEVEWECFGNDHKDRLATSFGFSELLAKLLTKRGYDVKQKWASKVERAEHEQRMETVYKPRWDRIDELLKSGFEFRYKQRRALEIIAENHNGRIDCHTGWGKGTLIMLAAMLFPKAKIDVVTKRVQVLKTRLYPELAANLPSVGIIGGGQRVKGRRVMCISADSLHHGRPDADFVFVDEGHEACADGFAEKLGIYDHARMFAFSASWDMRLDNKDFRGIAMFGPIRLRVPYEKGVEHGLVVPIEVRWSDVIMDENPVSGIKNDVERKRRAIWTNEYRNKIIARDARKYGDDQQVLITVETVEHALHLKKLLPEFKLAFAGQGMKDTDIAWFRKHFPDQWVDMTPEKLEKITKRFSSGKCKKAIATTVWNVGVDFRNLEVLIRGDGGGSPINDVQIPGRNSRKKKKEDLDQGAVEKFVGIVHDYLDQFDTGFKGRANRRSTSYGRNKWAQVFPDKKKRSSLRRLMNMGSYV